MVWREAPLIRCISRDLQEFPIMVVACHTLIVEEHGGPVFLSIRFPFGQSLVVWITVTRKINPGFAHLVSQHIGFFSTTSQCLPQLDIVGHKRQLHTVIPWLALNTLPKNKSFQRSANGHNLFQAQLACPDAFDLPGDEVCTHGFNK